MKSIRARLLAGLMFGTLCFTLVAGLMVYQRADHEADEQSDLRLRQVAWALPPHLGDGVQLPGDDDQDDAVLIQVWDRAGRPAYVSEPSQALPRQSLTGFGTITHQGERWRVYNESRSDYFMQIAQPFSVRERIAAKMALRIVPPLLVLLPALAALIWIVVGMALRPLEQVAQAVRGRSPGVLQPLETRGMPPELLPIVVALNGLLEKIDSAMAAQRSFIADAAHELRSPLTALKLQLQLAERAGSDEQRNVAFHRLHERLDRSTHLVHQLLTLARHEQHQALPTPVPTDVLALARQVVADHSILAENRGIDLGVAGSGEPLWVPVHPEGLSVMLSNLVDNAVRYTQPGGQVDVTAGMERGLACLRVADNGPGVPEAERGRLFDRFYRPDGNAVWGCGLGLSIVRNVVDGHGAEIELSSNGGVGLVVSVYLPVV
ncbi:two-component sensor histidine kinase [Duganella rhizosphaerae]|uniref:ATP-binding protein n=1 Tax=Duganella rhizosphaerae TaxID=2885763 RepID=UPI0030EA33DC